jgi:acyl-coenzyme A thioesterase PaaI-like protein
MYTTPDDHDHPRARGPRRALADEVRALVTATILTTEGAATLGQALTLVREATRLLDRAKRSSRYEGAAGLSPGITEANAAIWETHAAFGGSNPMAPPVMATERPGRVEGTVTFGPSYEGGPGTVYGGFIAAAFDGMLGRSVISSGRLGVTRSLTVRYLHPTALSTPLRIEAKIERMEDPNITVSGRLWSEDRVTCEAEAIFRSVDERRYQIESPGNAADLGGPV